MMPASALPAATTPAERPVVEVRSLWKKFGDNPVLNDISLNVERGRTICVLGPSGSGKSTFLRCLNWLEKPDHGEIFLSGKRMGYREGSDIPMSAKEIAAARKLASAWCSSTSISGRT